MGSKDSLLRQTDSNVCSNGSNGHLVMGPDFSAKCPDFSAKRKIFLQIHRNTLEHSKVHPIRCVAHRTETYPILEMFLFLFTTRRFGGVGALEGREKVSDHIFLQIKKTCGRLWNQPDFSAKMCFWRKTMDGRLPDFSAKFVKMGQLTCDFLGDADGQSVPP